MGFEPTVGSHLRLISSQVHSTTLPPLRSKDGIIEGSSKKSTWDLSPVRLANNSSWALAVAVMQFGAARRVIDETATDPDEAVAVCTWAVKRANAQVALRLSRSIRA